MRRYLVLFLVFGGVVACGGHPPAAAEEPAPLVGSAAHRLTSQHVGDQFQLTVVVPRSYASDSTRRFPVIYVTDGNSLGPVAANLWYDMSFEAAPLAIVVAVDYPVRHLDESQGVRFRDLTPTPDQANMTRSGPVFAELGLPRPPAGGGAPAFLRFLAEEAVPFIDRTYRSDSRDRTLVGLSLGGLFTLYALTERPALFNRYVAISPSLWWDRRVMIDRLKALGHSQEVTAARLFVSVGLSEGNDPPYSMVGNVQALEAILKERGDRGPTWHVQYLPDETHSSSWPGALSRGLRYAFEIWPQKPQGR